MVYRTLVVLAGSVHYLQDGGECVQGGREGVLIRELEEGREGKEVRGVKEVKEVRGMIVALYKF